MERPKSIEKGQRYQTPSRVVTIDALVAGLWSVEEGGSHYTDEFLLERCIYLGPSSPGKGPGMEADADGFPTRCLNCGGDKGSLGVWCQRCWDTTTPEQRQPQHSDWFYMGLRDFPRQPALPAPAVPPPHLPDLNCYALGCEKCRIPAPGPGPVVAIDIGRSFGQGRMVGETRLPDGTPLSALGRVPCVRSSEDLKPKPPWVPSVDEDHWIPDVGERGTR